MFRLAEDIWSICWLGLKTEVFVLHTNVVLGKTHIKKSGFHSGRNTKVRVPRPYT